MSIIRKHHKEHYTTVDNSILEDTRLSWRAKGIAVFILSKPDGWSANINHIASQGTEGRDAVRSALQELAEFGYMKRTREQDDKGRYTTITHIADFPSFLRDGSTDERISGIYSNELLKTDILKTDTSADGGSIVNTESVNTNYITAPVVADNTIPFSYLQREQQAPRFIAEQEASSLQSPDATIENKATMRNEPSLRKKGAVLSESWRDLLMPVMVGHGDFALVSKQQWGNMRACAKQLQSAGASEDDVLGWWESVWCKGWPGLQDGKVKPAGMSQVLQGVGIWRASKPEPAQEAVASDEFQVIEEDME